MKPHAVIDLSLSTDEEDSRDSPIPTDQRETVLSQRNGFKHLSNEGSDTSPALPLYEEQSSVRVTTVVGRPNKVLTSSQRTQKCADTQSQGRPATKIRGSTITSGMSSAVLISSPPIVLQSSPRIVQFVGPAALLEECTGQRSLAAIRSTAPLSTRTTALLAEITGNERRSRKRTSTAVKTLSAEDKERKSAVSKGKATKSTTSAALQRSQPEDTDVAKPKKKARLSSAERKSKEEERQNVRTLKEQEREEGKERKRQERDEKKREKQVAAELAEANKIKTDKKMSTPEMIVDLPSSMIDTPVNTQIRELLRRLQIQMESYTSPVRNVIRWRRKVTVSFSEELGYWKRVPESIRNENHVMCLISAKEFVTLIASHSTNVDKDDLDIHVARMRSVFPDCTLIYMIEGLDSWLTRARTKKNKAYQTAVRGHGDCQTGIAPSLNEVPNTHSEGSAETLIDEDVVEDALLRLQVTDKCLVHQTAASLETAEWVASFTQHISTIPYR